MPTLQEALCMLQEGVAPAELDKRSKNFGFPVGCITLTDEVRNRLHFYYPALYSNSCCALNIKVRFAVTAVISYF